MLGDAGCFGASSPIENPACDNGIDDDGDGFLDLDDPGCAGRAYETSELPEPGVGISLLSSIAMLLWLQGRRRRP